MLAVQQEQIEKAIPKSVANRVMVDLIWWSLLVDRNRTALEAYSALQPENCKPLTVVITIPKTVSPSYMLE